MAVRCHLPLLYDASTAHYQCAINSKIGEIRIRSHVPQAYVAYTHITRMNEMWMMSHDDRLFCAMAPYHTQTEKTKLFWSSASFITFLLFLICVKLGYFRMFRFFFSYYFSAFLRSYVVCVFTLLDAIMCLLCVVCGELSANNEKAHARSTQHMHVPHIALYTTKTRPGNLFP